jgi:hypothetical protein
MVGETFHKVSLCLVKVGRGVGPPVPLGPASLVLLVPLGIAEAEDAVE